MSGSIDLLARAQQLDGSVDGHTYSTQFLANPVVSDTSPAPTRVDSEGNYLGRSTVLSGFKFSDVVQDPNTGLVTLNVQTVNKTGGLSNKVKLAVISADAHETLLGLGDYGGQGVGYGTYYLVSDFQLNPATTTVKFPITDLVNCFLAGTRLATASGDVAVEDLSVGDLVKVHGHDAPMAIVWIGERTLDLATHSNPSMVRPIRIRSHAFSANVPSRDLLVSPDHAILTDGVLVPARLLLNGGSIVTTTGIERPRYFHIELDQHAAVFAEGLTAETYLDSGNRAVVDASSGLAVLNADFGVADVGTYQAAACAPLALDPETVRPIWSRLATRAAELGMAGPEMLVISEPGLHLLVDGKAIAPTMVGGLAKFALPEGATSVALVSRGARPADTRPWLDDRRTLGVKVAGLTVSSGAGSKAIDLNALTVGWWDAELGDVNAARWTNGNARIVLPEAATCGSVLEVSVIGEMLYPVIVREKLAA